jgi:AraC family transcriptional regulator of adaptative response/methylated-DNA-[protein]-cysteine methyltransferase
MTPASYARGGRGAEIAFATAASPLGRLLVAAMEKGVCMVVLGDNDGVLERALGDDYPAAEIVRDGGRLKGPLRAVLG